MNTYELDFLPVGIDVKTGIPNKKEVNEWWFGRSIPVSRTGIRTALEKLNIQHSEQLLLRCYGLSLSDQYWMKPVETLEWIGTALVFDSGTSLWHNKLTRAINPLGEIEMKPFYSNSSRQMKLVSDFSWIPFEELRKLKNDIREIFVPTEFIDEERIEVLSKAVAGRVEGLQEMELEHKRQFTLGSLR